jgi:haloalkane dehalogenase
MDALRTPDDRFADLPDFPYEPRYTDDLPGVEGLRVAWVDEGARDGQVFLCLHGEPTWSYLYRKMIPVFVAAGHRVVAPDLLGFGRSDKLVDDREYSFKLHRNVLLALTDRLELENVTLVCQDWGGLLGLTLPLDRPALIGRLVAMNTTIADGTSPGPGFDQWKAFARTQPDLDVGRLLWRATPGMTEAEARAYDAPFPSARYKAGVRSFPELVPVVPDMAGAELGRRAVAWWGSEWSGPSLLAVGAQDPVLGPPQIERLRGIVAGAPEPLVIEDGGHFVQETAGERIARAALAAFGGA